MQRWVLPILALILAIPAFASDGVLEINQTCAVQTGCFAGDTAGIPVTINGTAGHSYRLTSDLTVPNESTNGIFVLGNDIGIDFNDFAILGPVTCSGAPVVCTPNGGLGAGVTRLNSSIRGTSVKNGAVSGMGGSGVSLGDQAEVVNMRVRWNGSAGISVGVGSTVSGNAAYLNGSNGIYTGLGSTVADNTAYQNVGPGINADSG